MENIVSLLGHLLDYDVSQPISALLVTGIQNVVAISLPYFLIILGLFIQKSIPTEKP